MGFHYKILIFAILFKASLLVKGDQESGRGGPRAPSAEQDIGEAITECIKPSLVGIVDSPEHVADYITQDSKWYRDVRENVCVGSAATSECWISSLLFIVDKHSPVYRAMAKCICEFSGKCEPITGQESTGMLSGMSLNDEWCKAPEKRPTTPAKRRFSSCISEEIARLRPGHSTSGNDIGTSITTFLHDHYTFCRSELTTRYSLDQRVTFQTLYLDVLCPMPDTDDHWRGNIMAIYEDATRQDSPMWNAISICKGKIYSNIERCSEMVCKDNSRCVEKSGLAVCECDEGYKEGSDGSCVAIDPCASVTCPALERCFAYRGRTYCLCQAGYLRGTTGKCENPCIPTPCKNNGVCTRIPRTSLTMSNTKCICRPPYTGKFCEIGPSQCSTPCHKDAACQMISQGNYQCRCNSGYEGDGIRCDMKATDPCERNNGSPCHQNARCRDTLIGYQCICMDGYKGDGFQCIEMGPCEKRHGRQCGTNARCAPVRTSSGGQQHTCTCMNGYLGDGFSCRRSTETGTEKFCLEINSLDAKRAVSDPNWFKKFVDELSADLQNVWRTFSGFMRAEFGAEYRTKPDGRVQATIRVTVWVSLAQRGGGADVQDLIQHFVRSSASKIRFSGFPTECGTGEDLLSTSCRQHLGRKCHRHAACKPTSFGGYECICNSDYSGDGFDCKAIFPDPCEKNPCRNGGTCEADGRKHKCRCRDGFRGANCQRPPRCPGNKVYTDCASSCRDSCELRHESCTFDCDPDVFCVCPDGMVERTSGSNRCIMEKDCRVKREHRAVCRAWGDPHYTTYDGSGMHDFMGMCSYTMSETKGIAQSDSRWFRIIAENEVRDNVTEVSWVKEVTIYLNVGGTVIVLQKDGTVLVNGVAVSEANDPLFTISRPGRNVRITTVHDVCIDFNGDAVIIKVPDSYKNTLKGLCGDFNGNSENDLIMENGIMAKDFTEFAVSHQFGECDIPVPPRVTCSESDRQKWSGPEYCGMFNGLRGSFSDCSMLIDKQIYFDACLFDICATKGNMDALEQNLELYVADCKDNGVDICDWRLRTGRKEFRCPAHSSYNGCASTCQNTCFDPNAALNCEDTSTEEGCICDDGYVRDGTRCVKRSECGCVRNFLYYAKGQSFTNGDAVCVCEGQNNFECRCKPGYVLDGSQCRKIVDPCMSKPCMNGGLCASAGGKNYICSCFFGYSGDNCEIAPSDPCSSDPCMNGGECRKVKMTYVCTCPDGYTGDHCERRFSNPCDKNSCLNGGICLVHENSYKCECAEGFTGKNCQKPPRCPGNKVYSGCASQCIDSCDKQHSSCTFDCDPDNHCVCPPGMVERRTGANRCISLDECPKKPTKPPVPTVGTLGRYCLEFKSTEVTQVVRNPSWFNDFVNDLTVDLKTILNSFDGFLGAQFGAQAKGLPNGKVQATLQVTVSIDLTSARGGVNVEDLIRHYVQSSAQKVRFSGPPTECGSVTSTRDDPCKDMMCDTHATCQMISGEARCICNQGYNGDGMTCNPVPKGPCEMKRSQMMASGVMDFMPECDSKGNYRKRQCNPDTDMCYCVNEFNGITIEWTEMGTAVFTFDCASLPDTCRYKRAVAVAAQTPDQFIPVCDENGNYKSSQCYSMTRTCSCVDTITGSIIEGTTISMDGEPINCDVKKPARDDGDLAKYCVQVKSVDAFQAMNDQSWFTTFASELTADLRTIWESFSGFLQADFRAEFLIKSNGKVQATMTVNAWIDNSKTKRGASVRDLIKHFSRSSASKARFKGKPYECRSEEAVAKDPCREKFGKKCGRRAICMKDEGEYTCVCEDGYAGDGFTCNRIRDRRAVCRVWGDPHYLTYDRGDYYDFQGMCTYVLSETRLSQTDSRWFRVVAENEIRDNVTDVSWVKSATVYVFDEFGEEYMITIEKDGTVMINGNNVVEAETPMFTIERNGRGVKITTMHNVCISFNGDALRIRVPESYKGELMGVCGNYNGDPDDELMMENGEMADDYDEFALSYQFGECDKTLPPKVVCKERDRRRWSGATYCGLLKDRTGEFKDCHGIVNTQVYFDTCVFDLCATGGDMRILKPALEEYVADCKDNGVDLCKWRATFGGKKTECPRHSTYHGCASTCQDTCLNPMASADCDDTTTVEDCICDEGYVREGTRCVKLSDCGCVHNSIYYRTGETIYFDTETCNCESRNNFMCKCKPGYRSEGGVCKLRYTEGTCGFTRAELLANAIPNTFIPECDPNGDYKPKQCYDFTRQCFCVHKKTGVTLEGTTMDTLVFNFRCDRLPVNCQFTNAIRVAEGNFGRFFPVCDEDGNYDTEQCDDEDMCYCVHKMTGVEVYGTKARLDEFDMDCDDIPKNYGRCRKQHGKECDKHATCKAVDGGYQCVCDSAYTGDGFTCTGKDGCEMSFGRKCHRHAACKSNFGNYRCVCKDRYVGDGYVCEDIEAKCREQHGRRCHRHGFCTAVSSKSYDCKCKEGYTGTGFRCNPMSECHKLTGVPCHSNARCERYEGSHQCKCMAGYQGDGQLCIKVDKCQEQLGRPCDKNAECGRNSDRTGYECRCKDGYTGNGLGCREMSECHKRFKQPCDSNARCQRVAGQYRCICEAGYRGDGLSCEEISQCEMSDRKCHRDAECVRNDMGDYECRCMPGYWGNGYFCGTGTPPADPCHRNFGRRCNGDAMCETTSDGGYECRCKEGYVGDGFACQEINRRLCFTNLGRPCATNARCSMRGGNYMCVCRDSYFGNGFHCDRGVWHDQCHRHFGRRCNGDAMCDMTSDGGHDCRCKEGYVGDGFECKELDRRLCLTNLGRPCATNARCSMRGGNYMCVCRDSFFGDGFHCDSGVWDNQCHRDFGRRCARHARCNLMDDGEYMCICTEEYRGDGFKCVPRPTQPPQPPQTGGGTQPPQPPQTGGGTQPPQPDPRPTHPTQPTQPTQPGQTDHRPGRPTQPTQPVETKPPRPTQPPQIDIKPSRPRQPGEIDISDRFPCFFRYGHFCHQYANCVRGRSGQYECRCWRDFFGDGFHCSYQPGDRCQRRLGRKCHENAECRRDANRQFRCFCNRGFFGDGHFCQADPRDQCERRYGQRCSQNARCQRGADGHECVCKNGFSGNGFTCQAVSQCSRRYGIECHVHAGCIEEGDNFYTCRCRGDYEGDGFTCREPDPGYVRNDAISEYPLYERSGCHKQLGNACHQDAFCLDTGDGYQCHCRDGFRGNGFQACDEQFCQRPSDINQGTVSPSLGKYRVGAVINYVCQAGHRLEGNPTSTCIGNRQWEGVPPQCVRDNQRGFGRTLTMTYGQPGQYQDECHEHYDMPCSPDAYCAEVDGVFRCSCIEGYFGDGFRCQSSEQRDSCYATFSQDCHENAECQVNRLNQHQCVCRRGYIGDGYECDALECQRPQDIMNGRVVDTEGIYMVNHVVTYQCSGGYQIEGNTRRTCMPDGAWSGTQPTCIIEDHCYVNFAQPCHHEADCVSTESGYVCVCKEGYVGDGLNCRTPGCQRPRDIEFGRILSDQEMFTDGNVIAYRCEEGYKMVGENLRTCQDDGQWSGSVPVCRLGKPDADKDTFKPGQPGQSAQPGDCIRFFGKACSDFAGCFDVGGGDFVCQCRSGYSGNGFECQDFSTHLQPGQAGEPADPAECTKYFTRPCNEFGECRNLGGGGYTCVCRDGYLGDGFNCRTKGDIQCQRPSDINQGIISSNSERYLLNTIITYNCMHGYNLKGDRQRTCKEDGSWSGFEPKCEKEGTGRIDATPDRPHNPAIGDCHKKFGKRCHDFADCVFADNGEVECKCRKEYTGNGFQCRQEAACSRPFDIPFGNVQTTDKSYKVNTVATFSCEDGYKIMGNRRRTCQTNGQWSGSQPRCEQSRHRRCSKPQNLNHGRVRPSDKQYTDNSNVRYTCNHGFFLRGDSQRVCQNGKWSGTHPACIRQ